MTSFNKSLLHLAHCMLPPGFIDIMRLLDKKPSSIPTMTDHFGLSPNTVRSRVRILKGHKVLHVCTWERANYSQWSPVFALGNKSDVPRPSEKMERQSKVRPLLDAKKIGLWGM